jgi:phosphoribosyl 1,2-cyclic phosphodiesterase
MSLFVASLNSGSNGNCYYVGNQEEAVLIDVGISCRETEARMARLGLSMRKVKAIFISHEHSDHIRGVAALAKKYQLPVYITPLTLQRGGLSITPGLVIDFIAENPVSIGDLLITPFLKLHDAAHPHSFTIAYAGIKVGVFTDLGAVCENLVQHFQQCHAAFLEANYDDEMLENGRYPYHLKRRIRGGQGHLSNKQALALFMDYKPAYMSHLFLAHLSKDNNDPELVHNLFSAHARGAEVVVASRYHETALYHISGSAVSAYAPLVNLQTSLF